MLTLILVLSTALQDPQPKPQAPADREAKKEKSSGKAKADVAAATPEQALRSFFIAVATKDEATLRAVTLPTEELELLLNGQALPTEQVEEFKAMMARQPIRAMAPGDEMILPGKRKMTVQPDEVTAERVVLLPEGSPVPSRVRKVEGRWRVDATPLIAARKAADAARKKAAEAARKKANQPDQ